MSLIHAVSDLFSEATLLTPINKKWKYIELGKNCKIQNGYPFKSSCFNSDKKGMPLVRIRDINKSTQETYFNGDYPLEFVVNKGDLLIGMDGDFNCNIWKSSPSLLNQRVCRIIPNEKILLRKFLFYGLTGYLKVINDNTSSTTVKHLSSRSISEIPYPLPPLQEQERIVAKLDSLFAHLESAKQGLEKIPVLLKQFRQAVLTQAVTGKLTEEFEYFPALENIIDEKNKFWKNENSKKKQGKIINDKNNLSQIVVEKFKSYLIKKYDIASFDQIASTAQNALKAGPFGSSLKKEFYVNKGYKIYGQEQVIKDDPFYGDYYIDEERFNSLKSCKVSSGDILISLVGTIGKVLIIPEDFEPGIINPRLVKLSLHNKINPKFIKLFLQSDFIINHLKDNSHGGTMDVLNLGILKELPIPVPSLEEQTEIVRRVEALFSKADAIEAQYKKLKEQIDQLPQAILAKAFRGEV